MANVGVSLGFVLSIARAKTRYRPIYRVGYTHRVLGNLYDSSVFVYDRTLDPYKRHGGLDRSARRPRAFHLGLGDNKSFSRARCKIVLGDLPQISSALV